MRNVGRSIIKAATKPYWSYLNAKLEPLADLQNRLAALQHDQAGFQQGMLDSIAVLGTVVERLTAMAEDDATVLHKVDLEQVGLRNALDETQRALSAAMDRTERSPGMPRHRLAFDPQQDGSLNQLDPALAEIANYAESAGGWASQAGLWFNPPIWVRHSRSNVSVEAVNERIAEIPFVFAELLAQVPAGSHVLDVGASESSVSLSLATLGYLVTAVDPRGYALTHPNITTVVSGAEELPAGLQFDAVICLSTIEHIGVGSYGQDVKADGDVVAMQNLLRLTRRGGVLVFTAPYGRWHVTDLQRIYDDEHLRGILLGWTVERREYLVRDGGGTWFLSAEPGDPGTDGVVLLRARKE
jgi:2-polyprenyl-3-methyl-5-hydroxy-6-metoxy-1,4-benzoquinol methylase